MSLIITHFLEIAWISYIIGQERLQWDIGGQKQIQLQENILWKSKEIALFVLSLETNSFNQVELRNKNLIIILMQCVFILLLKSSTLNFGKPMAQVKAFI